MPSSSPLTTDLYELNMIQAYLDRAEDGEAVFEFFVRRLPARRSFLLAAGLADALDYLETLRFLRRRDRLAQKHRAFPTKPARLSRRFRFTGDVHAIPEGSVCFPNEPLIRITAPLAQAQLVETRLINILHFQTLIASKAARMVLAAPGKISPTSACAPRTAKRPGSIRRARAISPALPAPPTCWPASATAFRSWAPWRTPSCRCMTTRARRLRISRARAPRASFC